MKPRALSADGIDHMTAGLSAYLGVCGMAVREVPIAEDGYPGVSYSWAIVAVLDGSVGVRLGRTRVEAAAELDRLHTIRR